jgi:MFS family permease
VTAAPSTADRRARLAVFWIFILCGVICSLWSTSLPALSTRMHIGETRLGIVLLLAAAGAVAVMPLTGRLCDRHGSRAVLRVGAPLSGLSLLGPALAGSLAGLLAAAFVLGAGIGSLDVAMNAHAITVEQRYGRPIMSAFHGFWSVGAALGSAVIAAGLHFGATDPGLIAGGAVTSAVLLVLPGPFLLPRGAPRAGPAAGTTPAGAQDRRRRGVVALMGVVVCAGFICEGSAFNWAPLHAIKELHAAPATAALVYTVFATSMTIGRLTGDRVRGWLGAVRTMAAAGGTAACGYLLVLIAPSLGAGGLACDFAGWAVAGFGLATVVPSVFSAVGALDGGVGRALSRVAMCGYAGELAGPAVIGPVAGATSLRVALLVPGGLALLITGLGPVAVSRAIQPGRRLRPGQGVAAGHQ